MAKAKSVRKKSIGDEAVLAATGRRWAEWFKVLDAAGCRAMDHKSIVAELTQRGKVGPWWRQMVAVEYERSRGLRMVNQNALGFGVSVTRTFAMPVGKLFEVWTEELDRREWMPKGDLTLSKATKNKYLRIASRGKSSIAVNFLARPGGKSQCSVEVSRLPDAKAVERTRAQWSRALDSLRRLRGS